MEYEILNSPPDDSWYYRLKDILSKLETELNDIDYKIIDKDQNANKNQGRILIRKRKQVQYFSSRGVADECCTHGCVYADIIMYCA